MHLGCEITVDELIYLPICCRIGKIREKDVWPIFFNGVNFKLHAIFMAKNQLQSLMKWTLRNKYLYEMDNEEQEHTNILIRIDFNKHFAQSLGSTSG